ncbi:MAG: hypothetical protein K8R46_05285, partial [Pirellulales bacterium]|nr:hypothetical protein [Pirellulales bacterium]
DLVLRDRDTDSDGEFEERLYALQDPNWNVVAIANTSGTILKRFCYSAYGAPEYFTSDFSDSTAGYDWETLYCGYRYDYHVDSDVKWHIAGHRILLSHLGRWNRRDPIAATVNPYRYCGNKPVNAIDPLGLYYEIWLPNEPSATGAGTKVTDSQRKEVQGIREEAERKIKNQKSPEEVCDTWGYKNCGDRAYPHWKYKESITGLFFGVREKGVEHFKTYEYFSTEASQTVNKHQEITVSVPIPVKGKIIPTQVTIGADRRVIISGDLSLLHEFNLTYNAYECTACVFTEEGGPNTLCRSGWFKHYLSVEERVHWAWKTMSILTDTGAEYDVHGLTIGGAGIVISGSESMNK